MRYRAKVLNAAMTVETTSVEASNESEARHLLSSAGMQLLDLKSVRNALPRGARVRQFQLTIFNQQLNSLLTAGQSVSDAVDILGRNDKSGRHRAVYDTLLGALKQGRQLSDAMAALPSVFPALYVAMVQASETTGTVQLSIRRFMQYQRQIDQVRKKLAAAAIYPAILIAVGFVVVAFLMLYVVPRFSVVFDDMAVRNKDGAGFIQIWGGFVRANTALAWSGFLAGAFALSTLLFHSGLRNWCASKVIALPWLGERIWVLQLARLYRTLGMLLRSGVTVLTAMKMTQASLPVAMQDAMRAAVQSVSEGRALSAVVSEQHLSTEVAQRLLIAGESSGNLDEMMEHIADFYDQEVETWIDTASRLVEPILMVGIGLIIGAIVLMLYTPIFDLANVS
jgi:general secretion pathway protein F